MSDFSRDDFTITSLKDELRVDRRCSELLREFHHHLAEELRLPPLEAGALAAGTDYLLRDFIIDHCRENLFDLSPHRVRQFGGTWYILRNLEPNLAELERSLRGITRFAAWCAGRGWLPPATAEAIAITAADTAWYQQRIDSFHAITGDGYFAWERECTLEDVGRIR